MKNTFRRTIVGALSGLLLMGCLTGCAPSESTTVATVGDEKLSYGEANFYSRYMQSTYESYASYLGYDAEGFWNMSPDGVETMVDSVKGNLQEEMEEMLVCYQNAEAYDVSLSDEEIAEIEAAADAFIEANSEETLEFMSASKENIVKMLSMISTQDKVYDAIVADVSDVVTDEEAMQKAMLYVAFPYTTSTNSINGNANSDELAQITDALTGAMTEANEEDIKEKAEAFVKDMKDMSEEEIKEAAEELGASAINRTFDADDEFPQAELCAEAFGLKEGEVTKLYKNEEAGTFYAAKLLSEFDEEATENQKTTIVNQRLSDTYAAALEAMKEGMNIDWNEKAWDAIDFLTGGVSTAVGDDLYTDITEVENSYDEDTALEVADGDLINIDYVGSIDGVEFEGGKAEGAQLEIGSGSFIDTFEEQLIGAHPGDDVTVVVTFPEDYHAAELAGQEAEFAVHVNGIY